MQKNVGIINEEQYIYAPLAIEETIFRCCGTSAKSIKDCYSQKIKEL